MKLFLQLFFCLLSVLSFGQTLKGKIYDSETKQIIIGATINLNELDKTLKTDDNGTFRLVNLPIGRYSIKVTCIGYDDAYISEVLVSVGKETDLEIFITENYQQLAEVVVKSQREYGASINDMATASVRSFSVEQTKRYAASWGDPGRMALSFAGTSNVNDQTNEIVIRGNSPKGLLWKIDGIEVPSPNHFSSEGASGGGISALSTNVLSNSDFYTGAFPAEYGNASSGIFDIKLRKGNNEKRESSIQAGFQGIEASTEGPFSRKNGASYLVNYRYSTLKIIDFFGLNVVPTATPNFQDAFFKLFFPLKKTTISIWGLGALSSSDYLPDPNYVQVEKSNFFASGLNVVYNISDKTYWENILSFSGSENIKNYQSNVGQKYSQKSENKYSAIRYSSQINYKFNSRISLRTGVILNQLKYNLIDKANIGAFSFTKLNDAGQTQLLQGYIQVKYRIRPNLNINLGVHQVLFNLNKKSSTEPRIGGKWQISSKNSLSFGIGIHSRLEPLTTYMYSVYDTTKKVFLQPNNNLEIPKSNQYVLSYEFRPKSSWRIVTEIYLQNHSKVGVSNNMNIPALASYSTLNELDGVNLNALVSKGTGQNYGLEFTIERFFTEGFYILSTTSIFNSTYKTLEGKSRVSRFDNNFVQNLLAGKEWRLGKEKRNILSLNTRTTWAGGLRVIPIDMLKSFTKNQEIRDYSKIYDKQQLSNFFRTDFRISFIKNAIKTTSTFSLDLNNLTNHLNPKSIYFDSNDKSLVTVNQLGLIPVINYKLDF